MREQSSQNLLKLATPVGHYGQEQPEDVFMRPQHVYIFTDGQIIGKDTPCFRLDLAELLKKYYFLNMDAVMEEMQKRNDKSKLAEIQIKFYQDAVQEILTETSIAFKREYGVRYKVEMRSLFQLDGSRIQNILEIPKLCKMLVVSEENYFVGVSFEDDEVQEAVAKEKSVAESEQLGYTSFQDPGKKMNAITKNKVTFGHVTIEEEQNLKFPDINASRNEGLNGTGEFNYSGLDSSQQQDLQEVYQRVSQATTAPAAKKPTEREVAEMKSEALLSKSIIKRREWTKKYRVSDSVLFDLFSEFSSMTILAKKHRQAEERQLKSYKRNNKK